MPRPSRHLLFVTLLLLVCVAEAFALDVRVARLQAASTRVALMLELRDLLRDKFLETIQRGRPVFVQLRAELWEDRRISDRLTLNTPELTYRVERVPAGGVSVIDSYGNSASHDGGPTLIPIRIDLGPLASLQDDRSYYVRVEATAATFAEGDIDRFGAVIFGDDQGVAGLANLGRYLFSTLLRIGRYLESATAEVSSDRYTGLQIRTGRP